MRSPRPMADHISLKRKIIMLSFEVLRNFLFFLAGKWARKWLYCADAAADRSLGTNGYGFAKTIGRAIIVICAFLYSI